MAVAVGSSGNGRAGLPPSSSTNLHRGAAPYVDDLATFLHTLAAPGLEELFYTGLCRKVPPAQAPPV